ncbi:fluoride efflux transporter CrcB [Brachybacterium endophyticum]|uniref:Fluoride-specific ion channel FluC n=1 Tax=Brachybacterium endophyticum TaxID=2182385 RepID=A0A2U2RGP4_9MICO|nr:fluoride efflux transporter CrcB [Brachybacterium endophyticum]PWH04945.1 fluoride efflux transporter CrcB [Brachybacterium endophyticum]
MTPLLFLGIALAGGLGSTCRLYLDGVIRSRTSGGMPLGTITINLTGSFLLGLITGFTANQLLPDTSQMILGAGFLGGYTTFSTASFETIRLMQERRWIAGGINGLGVLAATALLAGLGLWLGSIP